MTPTKLLLATKYFSESAVVYMLKTKYFEPSYLSVGTGTGTPFSKALV